MGVPSSWHTNWYVVPSVFLKTCFQSRAQISNFLPKMPTSGSIPTDTKPITWAKPTSSSLPRWADSSRSHPIHWSTTVRKKARMLIFLPGIATQPTTMSQQPAVHLRMPPIIPRIPHQIIEWSLLYLPTVLTQLRIIPSIIPGFLKPDFGTAVRLPSKDPVFADEGLRFF
jgi:hypothetical protein